MCDLISKEEKCFCWAGPGETPVIPEFWRLRSEDQVTSRLNPATNQTQDSLKYLDREILAASREQTSANFTGSDKD